MNQTTLEIAEIVGRLDDYEQSLLLEIARRFVPDDTATPDDVENHKRAIEEHERGESRRMKRDDWS
jgi:hypothetical protein